jgi:hypothetical protein
MGRLKAGGTLALRSPMSWPFSSFGEDGRADDGVGIAESRDGSLMLNMGS